MDVGVHCTDTLRFILGEVQAVWALSVDGIAAPQPVLCCHIHSFSRS
jgi:predicted dehydrogenase